MFLTKTCAIFYSQTLKTRLFLSRCLQKKRWYWVAEPLTPHSFSCCQEWEMQMTWNNWTSAWFSIYPVQIPPTETSPLPKQASVHLLSLLCFRCWQQPAGPSGGLCSATVHAAHHPVQGPETFPDGQNRPGVAHCLYRYVDTENTHTHTNTENMRFDCSFLHINDGVVTVFCTVTHTYLAPPSPTLSSSRVEAGHFIFGVLSPWWTLTAVLLDRSDTWAPRLLSGRWTPPPTGGNLSLTSCLPTVPSYWTQWAAIFLLRVWLTHTIGLVNGRCSLYVCRYVLMWICLCLFRCRFPPLFIWCVTSPWRPCCRLRSHSPLGERGLHPKSAARHTPRHPVSLSAVAGHRPWTRRLQDRGLSGGNTACRNYAKLLQLYGAFCRILIVAE